MQDFFNEEVRHFYKYCSKFSSLAIYGAGDVGRMVAEFMEENRIPFTYFCTTGEPEKLMLNNHEIKRIDEVIYADTLVGIIVSVSKKNVDEILCFLNNRRVEYFYRAEFLFQLFVKKCKEAVAEVFTADKYLYRVSDTVLDKNTLYIVCPASIGDTLYVAALVNAYKKENPSVKRVCLILKNGHKELGTLFSSVDELIISDKIVEILDRFSLYTQTWKLNNYIYGHFKKSLRFEYDKEYVQEGLRKILPRYTKLIMNLKENTELETIRFPQNVFSGLPVNKQERKVIIMPYARTAPLLPDFFWQVLVEKFHQKGYSVYTNVGSEKEKSIPGSEPIKKSLLDTALLCEHCMAVVALRSGLCDLLGFTKTKLIVINTSKELFDEWNLNDVFHKKSILNINCFACESYDKQLEEIIKIIG